MYEAYSWSCGKLSASTHHKRKIIDKSEALISSIAKQPADTKPKPRVSIITLAGTKVENLVLESLLMGLYNLTRVRIDIRVYLPHGG